jgi:hypothetical protein
MRVFLLMGETLQKRARLLVRVYATTLSEGSPSPGLVSQTSLNPTPGPLDAQEDENGAALLSLAATGLLPSFRALWGRSRSLDVHSTLVAQHPDLAISLEACFYASVTLHTVFTRGFF